MWNALVVVEHFGNRVKGAMIHDVEEIRDVLGSGFEQFVRKVHHEDAPHTPDELAAALANAPQDLVDAVHAVGGEMPADEAVPAVKTKASK